MFKKERCFFSCEEGCTRHFSCTHRQPGCVPHLIRRHRKVNSHPLFWLVLENLRLQIGGILVLWLAARRGSWHFTRGIRAGGGPRANKGGLCTLYTMYWVGGYVGKLAPCQLFFCVGRDERQKNTDRGASVKGWLQWGRDFGTEYVLLTTGTPTQPPSRDKGHKGNRTGWVVRFFWTPPEIVSAGRDGRNTTSEAPCIEIGRVTTNGSFLLLERNLPAVYGV